MRSKQEHSHSIPSCELCGGQSTLYCPSDSAFLCLPCDSHVHLANSLVSRHLRLPLSPSSCLSLPFPDDADPASSSSSACISTTQSSSVAVVQRQKKKKKKKSIEEVTSGRTSCRNPNPGATSQDAEAEAVFVIWCKRMGLESDAAGKIIPGASRVLGACKGRVKALPLRVAVAGSFWLGMRMRMEEGWSTWQRLKRVEEVSGVPAKLILAGEARVARALRAAQLQQVGRIDLREGWAECCP